MNANVNIFFIWFICYIFAIQLKKVMAQRPKYKLIKKDISNGSSKKYKTYFYHKDKENVYEVLTDGTRCTPVTKDLLELPMIYKSGSSLPKYINKYLIK